MSLRSSSTAASTSDSNRPTWMRNSAIATTCILVAGSVGYLLGTNDSGPKFDGQSPESVTRSNLLNSLGILSNFTSDGARRPVRLNDRYGTAEDFQKAIEELRATIPFPEEAVSTNPGILQAHGTSANNHHPGSTSVLFRS